MSNLVTFTAKAELAAEENLHEFIRLCRDDLKEPVVPWDNWKWPGYVQFTNFSAPKKVKDPAPHMLDADFIDFAKAYIRHEAVRLMADSRTGDQNRMTALRALEHALLLSTGSSSLKGLTLTVFSAAEQALREKYKGKQTYTYGLALTALAQFIGKNKLSSKAVHTWSSSIRSPANESRAVGAEADETRRRKLPHPDVLRAVADRFGRGFDLGSSDTHKDVYTTSAVAMLLSAPMRGSELHVLAIDLEKTELDEYGEEQYGWRVHSRKGFGWQTKWIPKVWVPTAREAVRRLRFITEDGRKLARYLEEQWEARAKDPQAKLRFYRHPACPNVADDAPLSADEACAALGFVSVDAMRGSKFDGDSAFMMKRGTYTLDILADWVFSKLPKYFPYVDKTKRLKYSEALMCMFYNQLHEANGNSPVKLQLPTIATLLGQLRGGNEANRVKSFFERHGYYDELGELLRATSHQFRHFLNTAAHIGSADALMTQEDIDLWSGRTRYGAVYDHEPAEDKARKLTVALRRDDGSHAAIGGPLVAKAKPNEESTGQVMHWKVQLERAAKPVSCEDIDLVPRGANIATLYGMCEHDFMFNPCEKFGDCLNCTEHHCIKGSGKTPTEQLGRITALLAKVLAEEAGAKAAFERADPGAQRWYDSHRRQREKLEQLVSILANKDVPDGSIVRLADTATARSHLHRVLRAVAMDALENNTSPRAVMQELLEAVQRDRPSQLSSQSHPRLGKEPADA